MTVVTGGAARTVKPVVLVFVGNYLPGHKAGGIIRTISNTVDHLCEEFEFRVVTSDRDLGDGHAYPGLELNRWHRVGNALVYYVSREAHTMSRIAALVNSAQACAIYLNSFFDPFTVKVLAAMWAGAIPPTRVLVAPRGEFAWASLGQKYPKKAVFMWLARLVGLYRPVVWHASSQFEADDIVKVMHVAPAAIRVAFDFALKQADTERSLGPSRDDGSRLRLVFLSRVAREKNLDFALTLLQDVRAEVAFDIYGPIGDAAYWKECQSLVARVPANVRVSYKGAVEATRVVEVFQDYDAFLFPTGGEAFGHVIVESLLAGTPVIVSRESPWRNLPDDRLGWDLDLADPAAFVSRIEALAALSVAERDARRPEVRAGVAARLADPAIVESHRRLFVAESGRVGR